MDLTELRQALRRGWIFGLVATLVVAISSMVLLGPAETRYAASSTVLVTPRPERFQTISTGVLRVVLPNVVVKARSDRLADAAGEEVGPELADARVETGASFVRDSGVLTITTRSTDGAAAIEWNRALADVLVEEYADDPYLILEVLDPARAATIPGVVERSIDLVGVALLSLISGVFVIFLVQRIRESGDIVSRVRDGGLRVLAELAVPGRKRSRPLFGDDEQVRRLALAISSAPGVARDARFVVVSTDTRPAVAVVDAMRTGLEQVGLATRHRVVLGPAIDDLPSLHREAHGNSMCVAVLDRDHRIDTFIRDVKTIDESEIPVVGVVVLRRRRA